MSARERDLPMNQQQLFLLPFKAQLMKIARLFQHASRTVPGQRLRVLYSNMSVLCDSLKHLQTECQ